MDKRAGRSLVGRLGYTVDFCLFRVCWDKVSREFRDILAVDMLWERQVEHASCTEGKKHETLKVKQVTISLLLLFLPKYEYSYLTALFLVDTFPLA